MNSNLTNSYAKWLKKKNVVQEGKWKTHGCVQIDEEVPLQSNYDSDTCESLGEEEDTEGFSDQADEKKGFREKFLQGDIEIPPDQEVRLHQRSGKGIVAKQQQQGPISIKKHVCRVEVAKTRNYPTGTGRQGN